MVQRKVPMRKCMGCGEMFAKKDLVRVVKSVIKSEDETEAQEYEIGLDLTGKKAGRGAYICKNIDCLNKAKKARRIQKALSIQISDEIFETMQKELEKDE